MTAQFAIDTNILIYALANTDDDRCLHAREIVAKALAVGAIVPVQMLGEFLNVCRRKNITDPAQALERVIEWLPLFTCPQTSADDLVGAAELSGRYNLAFFDACICVVTRRAGAEYLLSEDIQDGLTLHGITVVNPFNPDNADHVEQMFDD